MAGKIYQLLDHGYLELIESWGSDERIIEAARMSTAKGFLGWGPKYECPECGLESTIWVGDPNNPQCQRCGKYVDLKPGDERLLRYLWNHSHWTPFEMAGAIIEVQAPIFVFREWRTHRTCSQIDDLFPGDESFNEMSARYTPLPDLNYIPTIERLMENSKTSNKQAGTAKGARELTKQDAKNWQTTLIQQYKSDQTFYERSLEAGVPKELARIHLPVGRYSRMRASAYLRNWLAFLTLRLDQHAQYEIRVYAQALGQIISNLFPRTWELFLGTKPS